MATVDLGERRRLGGSTLEDIRRNAQQRLAEIEPLIAEAKQLRDVLAVLDGQREASERRPSRPPNGARAHTNGRAHGASAHAGARRSVRHPEQRAAKGANKRVIIDLVAQRPGITAAEIASITGIARTVVASSVSRLKRHGQLARTEQGGLCLPGSQTKGPPAEHAAPPAASV